MTDIFDRLKAPFAADKISWRVGSTNKDKTKGMALAYLDARDVMERLDDVCGPGGWQCDYPHANGKTVCRIALKLGGEWVWKADGAGDTDFEAEKGALSDAFKRAAVRWGIGRYLYGFSAPWVEIEEAGRSFKIKPEEVTKLRRLLRQAFWCGPLTYTDLAKKLKELTRDIQSCSDADELNACVRSYKSVVDQCEIDMPEWFSGEPSDGFIPLQQRIIERTAELNKKAA